jgi:hypothetical protein
VNTNHQKNGSALSGIIARFDNFLTAFWTSIYLESEIRLFGIQKHNLANLCATTNRPASFSGAINAIFRLTPLPI